MITYHIDIIPEKEGGYFVKVRELKGCMSQGETIEETLINISECIGLWVKSCAKHKDGIPMGKETKYGRKNKQ